MYIARFLLLAHLRRLKKLFRKVHANFDYQVTVRTSGKKLLDNRRPGKGRGRAGEGPGGALTSPKKLN